MLRLILFLDTNTLLHFKPIKDIDWCKLTGATCVDLVICMPVIHELDDKKRDSRLGKRARRVISEVLKAASSSDQVRPGVNCDCSVIEATETLHLGRDDQIIEIATLSASHEADPVAIVTSDAGMTLKCKAKSIRTFCVRDDDELPIPNSEEVKKLKALEREIARLKARQTNLTLCVSSDNGTDTPSALATVKLLSGIDLSAVKSGDEIRRDIRPIGERHIDVMPGLEASIGIAYPTRDQCDRYNDKLRMYYSEYDAYYKTLKECDRLQRQSISFALWLRNTGTMPAENVDVQAFVPSNVAALCFVGGSNDWTIEPIPPTPPPVPKGGIASFGGMDFSDMPSLRHNMPSFHQEPTQIARRNGELVVSHHEAVLKHHELVRIQLFVAHLPSGGSDSAFEIKFHITCNESIDPVDGTVTLKLE